MAWASPKPSLSHNEVKGCAEREFGGGEVAVGMGGDEAIVIGVGCVNGDIEGGLSAEDEGLAG